MLERPCALQLILPSKKKHGREEEARLLRRARKDGRRGEGGKEGRKEGGLVGLDNHPTRHVPLTPMQWQRTKKVLLILKAVRHPLLWSEEGQWSGKA
jgi:hypothetical protein